MINNIKSPVQLLGCILGHGFPTNEKEMVTADNAEELLTGGSSLPPQFYFQIQSRDCECCINDKIFLLCAVKL